MSELVQGRCPNGCGETLFLGSGGYVTCSWERCPDPGAASDALTDRPKQPIRRPEVAAFICRRLVGMAGDRGRSSDALIAAAAVGSTEPPEDAYPRDTADLGRCCEAFSLAPWPLRETMLPILAKWSSDLASRVENGQPR